jgi:hypothetical protein
MKIHQWWAVDIIVIDSTAKNSSSGGQDDISSARHSYFWVADVRQSAL